MNDYDITGKIGPLFPKMWIDNPPKWPMYSFDTPAYEVWNTIGSVLNDRGWTEDQIEEWLRSKLARWAMDGELGILLSEAAKKYAKENIEEKFEDEWPSSWGRLNDRKETKTS